MSCHDVRLTSTRAAVPREGPEMIRELAASLPAKLPLRRGLPRNGSSLSYTLLTQDVRPEYRRQGAFAGSPASLNFVTHREQNRLGSQRIDLRRLSPIPGYDIAPNLLVTSVHSRPWVYQRPAEGTLKSYEIVVAGVPEP